MDTSALVINSERAFSIWRTTSRHARRELLRAWIQSYGPAQERLAQAITAETGKPITMSRGEAARGLATLEATIEALGSFGDEAVPYDLMAGAEGCKATLRRFPRGPVFAITPFNFPVNLALHKLAPALGAGCSAVWKPAPQAPKTAALLLETFETAREVVGAPPHLLQIALVDPAEAESIALDSRIAAVSFTGSERVGHHLQRILAHKPILLELGGNAGVVLDAGIDAAAAAKALAPAAMSGAGQSCSSAQRFFVHKDLWEAFVPALVDAVKALPVGEASDPATLVGPMIDERSAQRVETWIASATAKGATVLLGGPRRGALLPSTLMTDVPADDPLQLDEAFAPVALLEKVDSFAAGLDRAADTRFGLRASAYSRDQRHLRLAEEKLRAGGVLLNLPPTFRLDAAPFGGVAASGNGFEGPRWAMAFFSEARLIVEGPAI